MAKKRFFRAKSWRKFSLFLISANLNYGNLGDDEFFSNPQEGKLAFTTASVMELFKANFDDFGGSTTLPTGNDDKPAQLTASVTNADTPNQELLCKNQNNCLLQYKRRYTPILHDIIPN